MGNPRTITVEIVGLIHIKIGTSTVYFSASQVRDEDLTGTDRNAPLLPDFPTVASTFSLEDCADLIVVRASISLEPGTAANHMPSCFSQQRDWPCWRPGTLCRAGSKVSTLVRSWSANLKPTSVMPLTGGSHSQLLLVVSLWKTTTPTPWVLSVHHCSNSRSCHIARGGGGPSGIFVTSVTAGAGVLIALAPIEEDRFEMSLEETTARVTSLTSWSLEPCQAAPLDGGNMSRHFNHSKAAVFGSCVEQAISRGKTEVQPLFHCRADESVTLKQNRFAHHSVIRRIGKPRQGIHFEDRQLLSWLQECSRDSGQQVNSHRLQGGLDDPLPRSEADTQIPH